jgi:hypothetical protein
VPELDRIVADHCSLPATPQVSLGALISDQGDAELERRSLEPKRQRGLLRAMAASFNPIKPQVSAGSSPTS